MRDRSRPSGITKEATLATFTIAEQSEKNWKNIWYLKTWEDFVLSHSWLILYTYLKVHNDLQANGKRKVGLTPTSNFPIYCSKGKIGVANFQPSPIIPQEPHPQGAKQFNVDHRNAMGMEATSRVIVKATIGFATTTLNKAERIAQQIALFLFTFGDNLMTYDLAQQWMVLHM